MADLSQPTPPSDGLPSGSPTEPAGEASQDDRTPKPTTDPDLSTLSLSAAVSPLGVIGGVESDDAKPEERPATAEQAAPADAASAERAEDDRLIER
ncbi:MAG: hypothetical protein AAF805_07000, partial [Planctomycetota bacterium]